MSRRSRIKTKKSRTQPVATSLTSGLVVKDIPGYPGFKADSEGHVWGKRGLRLKWQYGVHKYPRVTVGPNDKQPVHKLVCLAFHGLKPNGLQIRHLDGVIENTRPTNLQYGTARENSDDFISHGSGRGSRNAHSKLTEDDVVEMRLLYRNKKLNQTELAAKYDVSQVCIFMALQGTTSWKHVPNPCNMNVHKHAQGSKAPIAKLNEEKVEVIRQRIRNGESDIQIAKDYGVTNTAIWHIRHRYTYKHIP